MSCYASQLSHTISHCWTLSSTASSPALLLLPLTSSPSPHLVSTCTADRIVIFQSLPPSLALPPFKQSRPSLIQGKPRLSPYFFYPPLMLTPALVLLLCLEGHLTIASDGFIRTLDNGDVDLGGVEVIFQTKSPLKLLNMIQVNTLLFLHSQCGRICSASHRAKTRFFKPALTPLRRVCRS
jgi:hypothetical protein